VESFSLPRGNSARKRAIRRWTTVHGVEERKPVGNLHRPSGGFVHQPADGKMRQVARSDVPS